MLTYPSRLPQQRSVGGCSVRRLRGKVAAACFLLQLPEFNCDGADKETDKVMQGGNCSDIYTVQKHQKHIETIGRPMRINLDK